MQLLEELGQARMQGLAPPRKGGIFTTVNKQPALIERRRRELQVLHHWEPSLITLTLCCYVIHAEFQWQFDAMLAGC